MNKLVLVGLIGLGFCFAAEPDKKEFDSIVISPASANGADLEVHAVTSAVLRQRLRELPTNNSERAERLYETFREAGCQEPNLSKQTVKGTEVPNVICTLPGRSDEVVVVGAHLDANKGSSGALDNWSGAVLLTSLYQGLSMSPSRYHTYVFVAFTGQLPAEGGRRWISGNLFVPASVRSRAWLRRGLRGSKGFVKQLRKEQRSKIRAMVNLECIGASPTKIGVSQSNNLLASNLIHLSRIMEQEISGMNVDKAGISDNQPFDKVGIPTITIHSLDEQIAPLLHSPQDKLELIDFEEYEKTYHLTALYLVYLDDVLRIDIPTTSLLRGAIDLQLSSPKVSSRQPSSVSPTGDPADEVPAEQGDGDAQFSLGLKYASGQGVPQNDVTAIKWFRLAAERGHADAQYNLGVMYHNGDGVPPKLCPSTQVV